jgi:hypothetical protein
MISGAASESSMPRIIHAAHPTDLELIVECNMALADETEHRALDRQRER